MSGINPKQKENRVSENELRALCRAYTKANVQTLGGWATNDQTDDELKFRAIQALMDRGWGKPHQAVTAELKGEVRVVLREMLKDEDE